MKVRAEKNDEFIIDYLNLKPIGLLIEGNENELKVGTNTLKGNVIVGTSVGIKIGANN
jgi:hypothetical protein